MFKTCSFSQNFRKILASNMKAPFSLLPPLPPIESCWWVCVMWKIMLVVVSNRWKMRLRWRIAAECFRVATSSSSRKPEQEFLQSSISTTYDSIRGKGGGIYLQLMIQSGGGGGVATISREAGCPRRTSNSIMRTSTALPQKRLS